MSRLPRLALVLLLAGCARGARLTHSSPIEAETGVPVRFGRAGGPALEWHLGEGGPILQGEVVEHAFPLAGRYGVRGLRKGEPFEQVEVLVAPRKVLRAVPAGSEVVLFVHGAGPGTLEPAVDFLERALAGISAGLAERQPFARYALELSAGPPPDELGLDPQEGLAVFLLREPPVVVTAVGIADPVRALAAARRQFAPEGARVLRVDPQSFLARDAEGEGGVFAFVDRGYLYVARLDPEEARDEALPARLLAAVREAPEEGISEAAGLLALQDRVFDGQAYLFVPQLSELAPYPAVVALRFTGSALELDGAVHAGEPLWDPATAQLTPLLVRAPEGPALALSVSFPPELLAGIILGLDSEQPEAVMDLTQTLTGEAWIAGWLDAGATALKMARKDGQPEAVGTLHGEVGIRDRKAALLMVDELLRRSGHRYRVSSEGETARFHVRRSDGDEGLVEVRADRVSYRLGEAPRGRQVALADVLRARSFPGAFGKGHVSLALDLGQVLRDLEAPTPGHGGAGGTEAITRGFLATFISQMSAVDAVMLDVLPEPQGARIRGRVTLR